MLYDHHRCSESAGASQPIFVALNHIKLILKSTKQYLYSSVWQWAPTHECEVFQAQGEISRRVSEQLQGRGWGGELAQPGMGAGA